MARVDAGRLVLASSMVVYGEGAYDCPSTDAYGRVRGPRRTSRRAASSRLPACAAPLTPGNVDEDAPMDPRNAYADTKLGQEHLAASWARATGGSVVALRYHNVYGPRMPRDTPYSGVAAIFRSCLDAGGGAEGLRRRRAAARLRARTRRRAGERARAGLDDGHGAGAASGPAPGAVQAYNVASGEPHTIEEMATALAKAYGGPAPVVTGEYRLGDVRHIVASPARAVSGLGFHASVGFEEGMAEFARVTGRS